MLYEYREIIGCQLRPIWLCGTKTISKKPQEDWSIPLSSAFCSSYDPLHVTIKFAKPLLN